MPLVVPGINSSLTGDKKNDWMSKLMGKKLSDSTSDELVWAFSALYFMAMIITDIMPLCLVVRKEGLTFHPSCRRAK